MSGGIRLPKGHTFTAQQEADRKRWARRFITRLEGVGHGLGYAIFHGGTLIRDIDVCAWPMSSWDTKPDDPFVFIEHLIHRLGARIHEQSDSLFGHAHAWLWLEGHEDHLIDLKIVRPAAVDRGDTQ